MLYHPVRELSDKSSALLTSAQPHLLQAIDSLPASNTIAIYYLYAHYSCFPGGS